MENNDQKRGFFKRLKAGLAKTQQAVTRKIEEATLGKREISEELLDNLEEVLVTSDLGINTAISLMETIRWKVSRNELSSPEKVYAALKDEIATKLAAAEQPLQMPPSARPFVILAVGVNGTGKTTTIAKIAHILRISGHSVLLAAADTFRAAAIDQLEIWAQRAGCRLIKHKPGADPSAVAYDAVQSAVAAGTDYLIIDTAGRLHTKQPLMDEIKKIHRTVKKQIPEAPHETLLVLDATTGQNAISQAKIFSESLSVSGLALTKLDGTAKGGVIVGISDMLKIPIRYIGVGEQLDDLREFSAREFTEALFEH